MKDGEPRVPGILKVGRAVGIVTFLEIVRDRVLYNVILCAMILFGIALLASRLMVSHQDRVMLDFGNSALVISCAMIAILCGSGMIGREFERRTVFVALSRPISRMQFVIGKYVGLVFVLLANWVLLTAFLAVVLVAVFRDPALVLNAAFGWAVLLALFESLMLGALAVLFSALSTTSLAVIFSVGAYLVGNNVSQVQQLSIRVKSPAAHFALEALAAALPDFERFNLGTKLAYSMPVEATFGLTAVAYAALVVAAALALSGVLLQWREG